MSFTSLLNKVCDIEISLQEQSLTTGEVKRAWQPFYKGIKCRLRTRSSAEKITGFSQYKHSTHVLYLEFLNIEEKTSRIIIEGKIYHITGQLNMGGGHEYLCLYLEVKE
ncbi:phage head-tail adaptor [Elusimicrobium minutum Pei191]|uniref:Phage head-tail adaptor n=1 Tax=Elusimicrobium minutum (strain Pei191) TaxID=445932 RepID=B2KDP0_ELUMP|nr:head-tail adaptor protein [Elusimicrobium minutum]ACC98636.1 phage head-tail adaptor [Elusimicrobium minutum Pei191]